MPVMPAKFLRADHSCPTSYTKQIVVVDMKGRKHETVIGCCKCEAEACTLVRFNLWPASPTSPIMAFQCSLMELQRMLFVEAQVSTYAFCSTLEQLNSDYSAMVSTAYYTLYG